MKHEDFKIGLEFWMSGNKWRCTGVVLDREAIVAIKLDKDDPSWYNGPPYAVVEHVIDEYALPACAIDRADSNG